MRSGAGLPGFAEHRPGIAGRRAPVSVRPAIPEDLAAIERVQHSAGRESHPEACLRAISDPQRLVVVAEVSGQVRGWAQTHRQLTQTDPAPAGQYLGGVTVDPDWRQNRASIDLHARWGFEEVLRAPQLTGVTFTGGVGLLMHAGSAGHPVGHPGPAAF